MNGILYFSSTGNSLQIAQKVQKKFGGGIFYIPKYLSDGCEFDRIFIVTPIYSYGMPMHVYELLPRLDKEKEIIIIQNYGGMSGNADRLTYEYCLEHSLNIKSIYKIKMPENFTLTLSVPKYYMNNLLRKSDKRIDNILQKIADREFVLPKKTKTKEKVYLKNKANWHLIGRRFSVTDDCVKCGKCVDLCPSQNISLTNKGIVFADKCVACLGCYHRCPKKAIVYLNKSKKDRYVNPNIDESNIGKDIL
ncbi:MAG: 4Fe-4S binding protein [Clostridia bacterium]|nr:4Fe-4S binding protein [Clostridia bacterium]